MPPSTNNGSNKDARFPAVAQFSHAAIEHEILEFWEAEEVFRRSVEERKGALPFVFYEGPPTANGRPGLHHMISRTIKDTFCRYKTMKGFLVDRKAGWDTHGLPVEIEVEKQLGLKGRDKVLEFGIEAFNTACRESVMRYKDLWDQLTVRMGYWVDLSDPYITFNTDYIESVWNLLKRIHERGLLYKGYKIQWYSPGSGTVLSSHEVGLGYAEVQDPSVYVRFRIRGSDNTSFLAWTTTPWTLVSNAALAVGKNIEYVKVRLVDQDTGAEEFLILARDLLHILKQEVDVSETFTGAELAGMEYEPLFPYFEGQDGTENAWRVAIADFVSTDDGTGIVHIAPAFGADDYELGSSIGLPVLNPIAPDGRFTDQVPDFAGLWFKDADKPITRALRTGGKLFRQETYLHNYPHDWRKGTPLISYPVESWFIRTTAIKDRLVDLNRQINWQPPSIGAGRFGQWLENNVDWAISRSRFWGTPLPIWVSDAPESTYFEVIGSVAELRQKCGATMPDDDDLDLHRPYVDAFTWPAPDGGTMRRVPDLVDVWFDSGAMPFAQWHYPFENRDLWNESFPADFIAEGVDQTRGWFYTLHAIGVLVEDKLAYKTCVVNGLLLDEKGEKMSKTKGNSVEPFDTIQSHGADPVRWYIMSNSPPWENLRWSERGLVDTTRKFFGTLSNVYSFFSTYANIDGFTGYEETVPVRDRVEMDRWIRSRLESTKTEVTAAYEAYHPTRAARSLEAFVDDLSNWYVRRNRRRFWKSDHGDDKRAAYQTVRECLVETARMMAPIAPFYSEWLYQALHGGREHDSVHLDSFPEPDHKLIDADLEHRMKLARTVSSIVLALRNAANINVRQPLSRMLVVTGRHAPEQELEQIREIVLDEVNVRDMEYIATSGGLVEKTATPDFKLLGRRLGKLMKPVNSAVRAMSTDEIDTLEQTGTVVFDIPGEEAVELRLEEIHIHSKGIEGWEVEKANGVTVALDMRVTDDLRDEGLAREFVNRVQNLRKTAGFDVVDRVRVSFRSAETLKRAVFRHDSWIRNETLANELEFSVSPEGESIDTFEIAQDPVTIGVRRVYENDGD